MKKKKMSKKEDEIEDKQEPKLQEKKQSGSAQLIIIAIIFIIIIFFTVFAYKKFIAPQKQEADQFTFNNFVFTKKQNLWQTQVQIDNKIVTMSLHYTPHETRRAYIGGMLNQSFNQGPLYITFDPTEENLTNVALAIAELSLNLAQGIGRELVAACSQNITEACQTRPIVNCDSNVSVIYLMHGPTPFVKFDDNCIVITGEGEDLVKAVDKLLYFWYGIINADET